MQQILLLRLIAEKARLLAEKARLKGREIYNCFTDFQKAFDSIKRDIISATFKSYGVSGALVNMLHLLDKEANGTRTWRVV